jgi:hypothetical protein
MKESHYHTRRKYKYLIALLSQAAFILLFATSSSTAFPLSDYRHRVRSKFLTSQHPSLTIKSSLLDSWNKKEKMVSELRQRKNLSVRGGSTNPGDDNGTGTEAASNSNTTTYEEQPTPSSSSEIKEEITNTETSTAATTAATTASTSSDDDNYKPGKVRRAVFPIYGKEVNKFMLMGSIKFFVIMALTLTRDTKDTLVVTQCGAEAIAFLKVCTYIYVDMLFRHFYVQNM